VSVRKWPTSIYFVSTSISIKRLETQEYANAKYMKSSIKFASNFRYFLTNLKSTSLIEKYSSHGNIKKSSKVTFNKVNTHEKVHNIITINRLNRYCTARVSIKSYYKFAFSNNHYGGQFFLANGSIDAFN